MCPQWCHPDTPTFGASVFSFFWLRDLCLFFSVSAFTGIETQKFEFDFAFAAFFSSPWEVLDAGLVHWQSESDMERGCAKVYEESFCYCEAVRFVELLLDLFLSGYIRTWSLGSFTFSIWTSKDVVSSYFLKQI